MAGSVFCFIGIIGIAGIALVLGATVSCLRRARSPISCTHVRGRSLHRSEDISATLSTLPAENSLQLGRFHFPARIASGHFSFIGATGSGKTMMQRLLMQSVLPSVGRGRGGRALVYDAKQDALSILAGMRLECPIRLLHPLDSRAAAWNLAADVTSPASALQVASILIPRSDRDTNPFFTNAARHLLYAVIICCIQRAPSRWTFRHILLILRDGQLLRTVLERSDDTQHLVQYCAHEGTFQNILSTLLTVMAPYEIIAAAWDRATKLVSLRHWIEEESILVLGNDEANRVAVDTMNRLLLQRLSELLLAQSEVSAVNPRQTWLFLDEVREAGRLEGLPRLLTKGRSKGVAVSLGLQDVAGLQSAYGKEIAEEILGQCNSKVILRLNSPGTAKWASQLFGTREVLEKSRSQNRSRSFRNFGFDSSASSGEAVSSGITRRDVVLESEFLDLPEPTPEAGLDAYFLNPITGGFRDHLPGDWIQSHLMPPDRSVPDSVLRPETYQYLRPWSDEDSLLLGLNDAPGQPNLRIVRGQP